jgi:hypothetical protein
MPLKIVGADERFAQMQRKTSLFVLGPPKIGKTSLLYGLPTDTTLCLDFEAGMKSVMTWRGRSITLRTIEEAWHITCLIGGPNPAVAPDRPFGAQHYEYVKKEYGGLIDLATVRTVFFDSASDLSHVARLHAEQQPAAFNKRGDRDNRGMYGELGRLLVDMFTHMQLAPDLNIVFVAKLDRKTDDLNRVIYEPQMEGQMASRVLPGLVDAVVSMSLFDYDETTGLWTHNWESGAHRAFCCHRLNPWGLPAGGRFLGTVNLIEEPHLGHLIENINRPAAAEAAKSLTTAIR